MRRQMTGIIAILLIFCFTPAASALDNSVREGAKKVEGGVKAIGRSAEEVGGKAAKAAGGAAKDTGNALGRAWDDIVKGLKKAFK